MGHRVLVRSAVPTNQRYPGEALEPPVVVFRADGGTTAGLGHLRRCITLARELARAGAGIRFVMNPDGPALELLRANGFEGRGAADDGSNLSETLEVVRGSGATALVVDSYAVSSESLARARALCLVAVIDDLADRMLPVDLVVNGRAGARELPYRTLSETQLLLGPQYILLESGFARRAERAIRPAVERVLVTVGGTDSCTLSGRLVGWSREALGRVHVDVVVGPFFSPGCVGQLEMLAKNDRSIVLHRDQPDMEPLMRASDLVISGGGQTVYELAATGTPAVAIRMAENQTANLRALAAEGSLVWTGDVADGDLRDKVVRALGTLARNTEARSAMSVAGQRVVDGLGARRAAGAILAACRQRAAGRRQAGLDLDNGPGRG